MKNLRVYGAILVTIAVALGSAGVRPAAAGSQTPYYLALGDSMSQGVQPNSQGHLVETNQGYTDDLYKYYRSSTPGLKFVKLGCPGETTGTMINGGICPYRLGSQLAQAVNFLSTHRITLVTLDIGANDIDTCITPGAIDQTCMSNGFTAAQNDLPQILSELQQAAGPGVPIVATNYYDPFLAYWLLPDGQRIATQTEQYGVSFNSLLSGAFASFQIPMANVQDGFQTTNFNIVPPNTLPTNVVTVCNWTWMCAASPFGNIHANTTGYQQIAVAFEQTIGPLLR